MPAARKLKSAMSGAFDYVISFGDWRVDAANSTLTLLRERTTVAPVTYSNVTFAVNTTFSPQAPRDLATPDLGNHYAPLGYAFGGCHTAADLHLLVTAGTALGWFRTNSGWQHAGPGLHWLYWRQREGKKA